MNRPPRIDPASLLGSTRGAQIGYATLLLASGENAKVVRERLENLLLGSPGQHFGNCNTPIEPCGNIRRPTSSIWGRLLLGALMLAAGASFLAKSPLVRT